MRSIRRLTQQGSAVALASFLVVSSSRPALARTSPWEVVKRWRERQPIRLEELRRQWLESRGGTAPWAAGERPPVGWRRGALQGIAPRFHADGLVVPEPKPLNALLDPLGFFEDESGEEPPVGPLARLFLADFDGDGDLDAFVGDKYGYVRYLRNEAGPGTDPAYVELTGAASPTGTLDLSFDDDDPGDTFPYGPSAPTLVDVDGDDDLDLFVGQGYYDGPGTGGRVLFFENVGGTLTRNDAANPLDGLTFGLGGATPTFVDVDGDDDFDVFVGTKLASLGPAGEVYFLRNDGDVNNPVFVDQTDVAGSDPFALEEFLPVTAPYFADVDGDGDEDAFVGEFYSTRFFRNDTVLPGPPAFVEETGYDHPLAGSFPFFPGPVLADVDGDGDLDAFVGLGYGKSYGLGFVQYFENTGTANDPGFLSAGDRIELVDVDGDGDLDALASAVRYALPIDGPPELELAVFYFRNLGTDSQPEWQLQSGADNPFSGFNAGYTPSFDSYSLPSLAPTVGDLDGDPALDAFVGLPDGTLEFLEDDGTGQLDPAATHPLEAIDFGESADPQLVDVDGDGELDLVVGYEVYNDVTEYYEGRVAFFLNPTGPDGLEGPPDLVLDFGDRLTRPAPTLADVDGDGDLDLLVGGYAYSEEYSYPVTLFLENTGTPMVPAFDETNPDLVRVLIQGPPSPALGDVNGDGLLDLFLGNSAGVEMFLTSVPDLQVTKVVTGGSREAGGTVEYTVTLTNVGTGTVIDDPDDPELTDTLPPELTLLSASVATGSGTVTVDLGTNSLRYDGTIDPGESATIVITAQIDGAVLGQTVENQAVGSFDSDGDGDNDTERPSDDPTTDPPADPTAFVVGGITSVLEIPTLSQWGSILFAGLLSLLGFFGLRRSGG